MKKSKKTGLIVLTLFLLLLVCGTLVFGFNIFNLRNKIIGSVVNKILDSSFESNQPSASVTLSPDATPTTIDHPLLNSAQEKTLVDLGVDISKIPTSISADTQSCLINAVGEQRAQEIMNGSSPTMMEIIKAKSCI